MQSYGAANMCTWICNFWDLVKKNDLGLGFTVHARSRSGSHGARGSSAGGVAGGEEGLAGPRRGRRRRGSHGAGRRRLATAGAGGAGAVGGQAGRRAAARAPGGRRRKAAAEGETRRRGARRSGPSGGGGGPAPGLAGRREWRRRAMWARPGGRIPGRHMAAERRGGQCPSVGSLSGGARC